jgi:hypothetical protein
MRQGLLVAVLVLLAGCGAKESTEEPGARGPVIMRWWDRRALEQRQAPTVITTQRLAETGKRFAALDLEPVLLRHPIEGGMLWLEAPHGAFDRSAHATNRLACPGPIAIHGWVQGRPVVGAASQAHVQAGGRELELTDLALVQNGRLTTTPLAALAQGRGRAAGPFQVRPGAPAVLAALAAVPDR